MASTASDKGDYAKRGKLLIRPVSLVISIFLVSLIVFCAVTRCANTEDKEALDATTKQTEQLHLEEEESASFEDTTSVEKDADALSQTPSETKSIDDTQALGAVAICPIVFSDAYEQSTRHNAWGDGWTFVSAQSTDEEAAHVLNTLQADSWDLVFASKLDLAGQAWGCVATHEQAKETVLVYMVPKVLGRKLGEDNPLLMNIVRVNHAS